jgi:hypothetical protein
MLAILLATSRLSLAEDKETAFLSAFPERARAHS